MQARKETRLSRAPAKALCSDRTPFLSRGQYAGTRSTAVRVPATETSSRRIFPELGIPVGPFVAAFFGASHRECLAFPKILSTEGVSTTWTPQTSRPLPCSRLAGFAWEPMETPLGRANDLARPSHLPCVSNRPAAKPLLLGPHSHAAGFQTPGRPSQAPDTTPAPTALPVLVLSFTSAVTSLSGVTRRVRCRMSVSPETA